MSDADYAQVHAAKSAFMEKHYQTYLRSGGADGHIIDLRGSGGYQLTTTLLVETFGRKSGVRRLVPLVYGLFAGEAVIVAARAGADQHPDWYWNIIARPGIAFQIGGQAFRGEWREPNAEERLEMWDFMTAVCPPFARYQASTPRKIPLIMLKPVEPIKVFKE
jgi:deazaflavin-dependent oxidoreductase (nitroreductase family)